MPKIVIEGDGSTGEVTTKVEGVKGKGCEELTKTLRKAFDVRSVQRTREYDEAPRGRETERQR